MGWEHYNYQWLHAQIWNTTLIVWEVLRWAILTKLWWLDVFVQEVAQRWDRMKAMKLASGILLEQESWNFINFVDV